MIGDQSIFCDRWNSLFGAMPIIPQAASASLCNHLMPVSETKTIKLPGPGDLPSADLVIYDGNCSFCTEQVRRLRKWDGGNRLAFVSLHDPFVQQEYPDLTHEELMKQMYVVNRKNGAAYGGARALRYLARRLPRLWWIMPILHIPLTLPLWQWLYLSIAARRYKLHSQSANNCDNDSCDIHFRK